MFISYGLAENMTAKQDQALQLRFTVLGKHMSNLFRKEALDHRSRALYGEVVLRAPLGTWVITALLIALVGILIAGLFLLQLPLSDSAIGEGVAGEGVVGDSKLGGKTVSLFEWLRAGGK